MCSCVHTCGCCSHVGKICIEASCRSSRLAWRVMHDECVKGDAAAARRCGLLRERLWRAAMELDAAFAGGPHDYLALDSRLCRKLCIEMAGRVRPRASRAS